MNTTRYGIFCEQTDLFVALGTFESEVDAHIAISEFGLDMEYDYDYYVAPAVLVIHPDYNNGLAIYEPGEES